MRNFMTRAVNYSEDWINENPRKFYGAMVALLVVGVLMVL